METLLLICAMTLTREIGFCPGTDTVLTPAIANVHLADIDCTYEKYRPAIEIKKVTAYEVIKNKAKYEGCVVVADQNYLMVE